MIKQQPQISEREIEKINKQLEQENVSYSDLEWKSVCGFDGRYIISNRGDVFSRPSRLHDGKILKPNKDEAGYPKLTLCKDGKRKDANVHRLVALHFVDNPEDKDIVDHKNNNKEDNRSKNLRWVDASQNAANMKTRETKGSKYKGVCWHSRDKNYHARIKKDGDLHHIGCYQDEEEAAAAYNEKAKEIFGSHAKLNELKSE